MSKLTEPVVVSRHEHHNTSMRSYVTGFVCSIVLTGAAFALVGLHLSRGFGSPDLLIGLIAGLAVIQLWVQLIYFLHIGQEGRPRWKAVSFVFMLGMVLTLVIGSLWIMHNLNYKMMHLPDPDTYMRNHEGL